MIKQKVLAFIVLLLATQKEGESIGFKLKYIY